ncbi:MAG: tetratricopeptide repeat protein [Nitrospirae bacterium]|nr:tetratricopeptide repeat protein [Nitrospirota bacterium]
MSKAVHSPALGGTPHEASGTQGWLRLALASAILVVGCAHKGDIKQAEAHYKLGYSYLIDQQIQPAFVEFQKAVEFNPGDRDTHYALAHVYFLQQNFSEAERELKRVLKIDDRDAKAWNYLGMVYDAQGRTDLALLQFDHALSLPQYATPELAHYNKGRVYLKKGRPDDALRAFVAAVRVNPSQPYAPAAYEAGRLYLDQGAVKEAIEVFRLAIQQVPNAPEAHLYLAKAYAREGMDKDARESYQKVIELAPGSRWAEEARTQMAQPKR